jgi:uncharacterized protein YjbJ (UPF0337 family)
MESTKGSIQDIAGKVQDAVRDATGDVGMQAEGTLRQAAGKLPETYRDALEGLRKAAVENPLATLAAVAGIGFVLRALWARRD